MSRGKQRNIWWSEVTANHHSSYQFIPVPVMLLRFSAKFLSLCRDGGGDDNGLAGAGAGGAHILYCVLPQWSGGRGACSLGGDSSLSVD